MATEKLVDILIAAREQVKPAIASAEKQLQAFRARNAAANAGGLGVAPAILAALPGAAGAMAKVAAGSVAAVSHLRLMVAGARALRNDFEGAADAIRSIPILGAPAMA